MEIIEDDLLMRLFTFPNVLITSHQAFFTERAMDTIAKITIQNLDSIDKTGKCVNGVHFNL